MAFQKGLANLESGQQLVGDLSLLPAECCPAFFEMPWTSWHLGVWQQSCLLCLSGELAHHCLALKSAPGAPSFPPSFAVPLFTEQSEGNCLRSWEPGGQRQRLVRCSDFFVPPLFFLNFVLLLVFLLCKIFSSPSPFWPTRSPRTAGWEWQIGRSGPPAPGE